MGQYELEARLSRRLEQLDRLRSRVTEDPADAAFLKVASPVECCPQLRIQSYAIPGETVPTFREAA
jgi:hypothetical protein